MLNQVSFETHRACVGHALMPAAVAAPREKSAHIGALDASDTSFDNSTALGLRSWSRL